MPESFFREVEALSRGEIKRLQVERLRQQINYLSHHSPYYRNTIKERNITADDIRSLDDLKRLPTLDKYIVGEHQETNPPFGDFLCVPEHKIVKYFRTSGTTFHPRNFCYTYDDWMNITVDVMMRIKYATGVTPEDRVLIAFPYSTFISLWNSHYACENLGCMVIPGGGASTKERLNLMRQMKVTVLCATPTYANRLANVAEAEGMGLREIPLRLLLTGGEPLAAVPGSRARLEAIWSAKAYDEYGTSEGFVPSGGECEAQDGLHFTEDVLIPEIVGKNGKAVSPGEHGELIITNVLSKTMPFLRFKTGDIVTYTDEPCRCGRQSIRIKVVGRADDMILIKGTNVFPSAIEEMVKRCPDLSSEFMIVIEEMNGEVELIIQVEPRKRAGFKTDEADGIKAKLIEIVRENLRLRPVVQIKKPGTLPRFEVKSKRVLDKRKTDQ